MTLTLARPLAPARLPRSHRRAAGLLRARPALVTLRPRAPEARRLLALAHCTLGEVDKAVEIFEEWLEDRGWLSDEDARGVREDFGREAAEAADWAETQPDPRPEDLATHVYAR